MPHPPLTHHDIVLSLQHLGVTRSTVVEAHSSLSVLGWVEGGAATITVYNRVSFLSRVIYGGGERI